jgi:hypothetical protein
LTFADGYFSFTSRAQLAPPSVDRLTSPPGTDA